MALWPTGSTGTVISSAGPTPIHFDYLVDLDAAGSFYFHFDEIHPAG